MPKPTREREIEEDRDDEQEENNKSLLDDSDIEGDEEDDGPDNAAARKAAREEEARKARRSSADDDDDEEDERLAHDDDEEDEPRPRGRRARRNQARRLREQQSRQEIQALTGTVHELRQHLEQMSRSQLGLAAGDIDAQIGTLQGQLEGIEAAHAKAVSDGDGVGAAKAMRLAREAERRIDGLVFERRRLEQVARSASQPPQQRQVAQREAPDPRAASFANKFLEDHEWFDPEDPSDEESMIVKAIDAALESEGYRSNTKQYWTELRRRVKARGLGGTDMDDDDDDDRDDPPRRRSNNGGLPPRSRSRSGGRNGGGGFKLTQLMKDALEAEGLLEEKNLSEDQLKYRRRLVKKWKDGTDAARQNRAR